jgi:hypothetical protein
MKWLFILALFPLTTMANPARRIVVHKDEVVTVKTALGIATIIQVPDQPTSVVLGDSSAFKVEYLNQAITIKPLHGHATSNLYVHTDYERYSVKLVTGVQTAADYVVYLSPFRSPDPRPDVTGQTLRWKTIGVRKKSAIGWLTLTRLAKTSSAVLVDIEILPNQNRRLDPGIFWLRQGADNRPIQDLLLSTLDAKKGHPVTATLVVRRADLKPQSPSTFEVKSGGTTTFTLTKESLWTN